MAKRPVFDKELGAFFKGLRIARGWDSQRQAGQIARQRGLQLNYQAIQKLEGGKVKSPKPEQLKAIAALYEQPYADIAEKVLSRRFGVSITTGEPVSAQEGFSLVPVMTQRIAAGQPLTIEQEEDFDEYVSFRDVFTRRFRNPLAFRVGAGQQSMMPTLQPDDLVVLDRDIQRRLHPDSRNIYALNLSGGGTLKRVEVQQGLLIVSSDNLNKREYPTFTEPIAGRSLAEVIIGEVVWFGRYLGSGRKR